MATPMKLSLGEIEPTTSFALQDAGANKLGNSKQRGVKGAKPACFALGRAPAPTPCELATYDSSSRPPEVCCLRKLDTPL